MFRAAAKSRAPEKEAVSAAMACFGAVEEVDIVANAPAGGNCASRGASVGAPQFASPQPQRGSPSPFWRRRAAVNGLRHLRALCNRSRNGIGPGGAVRPGAGPAAQQSCVCHRGPQPARCPPRLFALLCLTSCLLSPPSAGELVAAVDVSVDTSHYLSEKEKLARQRVRASTAAVPATLCCPPDRHRSPLSHSCLFVRHFPAEAEGSGARAADKSRRACASPPVSKGAGTATGGAARRAPR